MAFNQLQSSRGRRRSGRNLLKSDAPTRRSSRISTIQMAAEIERSISGDLDDSVSVESEKSIKVSVTNRKFLPFLAVFDSITIQNFD